MSVQPSGTGVNRETLTAPSVVAVIPARGGSKGIQGKNLQVVGGRSLVERAVATSLACGSIHRVVVSTDDPEIARQARLAGAEIVERPIAIGGDTASSESAVLHAIDNLAADPDIIVLVQATSPFLWPEDLDRLVAEVAAGEADCACTVTPSHGFLWQRSAHGAIGVNHDVVPRRRRQDLQPEFLETGGGYAMRCTGLRSTGHRFFGRIGLVEVPAERSMEIDTPADLQVARDLAPRIDRRWLDQRLPDPVKAVVFDFDGVLTDNLVTTDQYGNESVTASRSDGMGVEMLIEMGVAMTVLSKERNPVTTARCAKLGLTVTQRVDNKVDVLRQWLAASGIEVAHTVFVGNDVNDVECLRIAGCGLAVADAHPEALEAADVVLALPGGRGAVRMLADALMERRGRSDEPTMRDAT
jgi:YrbI family 3-deoxy-D-manno-octulosonate 8-phosphate phosphatase